MSNTKQTNVKGLIVTDTQIKKAEFECMITNDNIGKTLSIRNGNVMYTIPFEPIEEYLK